MNISSINKTDEQLIAEGQHLIQSGRPHDALLLFKQVLRSNYEHAIAHNSLGIIYHMLGKPAEGLKHFLKSVEIDPCFAKAHSNLGNAYKERGDFESACKHLRIAISLSPDLMTARNNLGAVLAKMGQLESAVEVFRETISLQPTYAEAHANLGNALKSLGMWELAIASLEEALRIQPGKAEFLADLGAAFYASGQFDKATAVLKSSIERNPALALAHNNLGVVYSGLCRELEAIECFAEAYRLDPHNQDSLLNGISVLRRIGRHEQALDQLRNAIEADTGNVKFIFVLGEILAELGDLDEASNYYRQVLAKEPCHVHASNNLAKILNAQGQSEEAAAIYRQLVEVEPHSASIHSNFLYSLQYIGSISREEIYREHLLWDEHHGAGKYGVPTVLLRDPRPDRPLKIGYVSADLCNHPVGCFLAPVLPNHDRRAFTVYCYSDVKQADRLTERLKRCTDVWRDTHSLSAEKLADIVRSDGIDILVDLAGHTANNRLPMFALKPAPLQVTWAGYVGTTGLAAMDYLISDGRQSPPGDEQFTREQIIRLSDCYVCFEPPADAPPPSALPALVNGFITFGCFNNLAKVTEEVINLWVQVLSQVPRSRLLLKTRGLECKSVRERFQHLFAERGIDGERLLLQGGAPHSAFLAAYGDIDIALDPFPYSGGLTTLEALWMGVPVVTLGGDRFCSRHSIAHLTAAGLQQCIAESENGYLNLAKELASDTFRLASLRSDLRKRLSDSPLCDGPGFTRDLEQAFRTIWKQGVCAQR